MPSSSCRLRKLCPSSNFYGCDENADFCNAKAASHSRCTLVKVQNAVYCMLPECIQVLHGTAPRDLEVTCSNAVCTPGLHRVTVTQEEKWHGLCLYVSSISGKSSSGRAAEAG